MKRILLFSPFLICLLISCKEREIPYFNHGEFDFHTEAQAQYLSSSYNKKPRTTARTDISQPRPTNFKIHDNGEGPYKIYYTTDSTNFNQHVVETDKKTIELTNLLLNQTYFYRVKRGNVVVENGDFFTSNTILRNLDVDGITNMRDLGGYLTTYSKDEESKKVKQGMIFRNSEFRSYSGTPKRMTEKGKNTLLNELHIKSDIDLRRDNEHPLDPLDYAPLIDETSGHYFYLNVDWESATIDNRSEKVGQFFKILADANNYPISFHCRIGTDRTGMMAALLHGILGASLDHIYWDYMFSNFGNLEDDGRKISSLDSSCINYIKQQTGDNLQEQSENFLINKCNITIDEINSIRSILLE